MKKKATGIVREVDPQGRIVLPKGLRIALEIQEGDSLEVFTDGRQIICQKYQPGCVFCGRVDGVKSMYGVHVCRKCVKEISKLGDLDASNTAT